MKKLLVQSYMEPYANALLEAELSSGTIDKYLADVRQWLDFIGDTVSKEEMKRYKAFLESQYQVSTVNSKLISVNRFVKWLGKDMLILRTKRLQGNNCLDSVITKEEYRMLLSYAEKKKKRKMYLIMKVLANTGIRISELKYITVEAISSNGILYVENKGKMRIVYMAECLCRELYLYCQEHCIERGIVFYGRKKEHVISAVAVWKNMKYIAQKAGIETKKVHPHAFRHLFAKVYMEEVGNITELADILGHSRLETTWIYTRTTAEEKRRILDRIYF